jgi:hypothetical protein
MITEGSSRQGQRNQDGSYRIVCSDCRQYICDSHIKLINARCALCERALAGEPVPTDAIQMYVAGKAGHRDVSVLRVEDDDNRGGTKFTLRSLLGLTSRALGFTKPEAEPLESVKVSKGKRRPRLFADVDLSDESQGIGSMEQIDKALTAEKEGQ